jgi:hypothetical protein
MSTNVFGDLKQNADDFLTGLAHKIINEKEKLFIPVESKYRESVHLAGIGKPVVHRIILEFLIGLELKNNIVPGISPRFAGIQKNVVWVTQNRKFKYSQGKVTLSKCRNFTNAEKEKSRAKRESFLLLTLRQAESKIIELLNNYPAAL